MSKQIIWSSLAENDFEGILAYLDKSWNMKIAKKFIDITENHLSQISANPKQYPLIYAKAKVRKCVLTKHDSLYYREHNKQVELLRIYDTRQDPKKLKFTR